MASNSCIPSSSSSLSSTHQWEVFMSFRGEDTRKKFVDHLYAALYQKGIPTFKDDEELEKGDTIGPNLLKAIEKSRCYIVVLSENYASSGWCLDELVHILRFWKNNAVGRRRSTIYPVFYHVEPSNVRYQVGRFGEGFAEAASKHGEEKAQMWRKALKEVADLAGWVYPSDQYRFESKFIDELVRKICSEFKDRYASVTEGLVGIHSRMEKVIQLLGLELDDHVRTVGIWGMGGLGKTTIAEEVCRQIYHQFEAFSYLQNVREVSAKSGLVTLQRQLISNILGQKDLDISDTITRDGTIWERVRNKKVLIFLDDVDQSEQLEKLVQKLNGSTVGSRIIITTRDKQLLVEYNVKEIYKVEMLDEEESVKLFISKAFSNKEQQTRAFKDLVKQATKYAGGVPLALKVLGSSLKGKKECEWKSALNRLKEWPDQKVFQALKISYDALHYTEKQILLDIACFLKGREISFATEILDSCGFYAKIGISNLVDKSLISFLHGKVWMHDLIQEFGREIVRQESIEPEKRSRLWLCKDIYNVLKYNTGTAAVEGIILRPFENKELLNLGAEAFAKMTKLRLLIICNVQLPSGLEFLSNELRYLEWHGYPLKCFPQTFRPEHLVKLRLSDSGLKQLWDGKMLLPKLRIVRFYNLTNLTKCPDFTEAPELEKLDIVNCERLVDVHQSVGVLTKLNRLCLAECSNLTSFPTSMDCRSLERLVLGIGISKLSMEDMEDFDDTLLWQTAWWDDLTGNAEIGFVKHGTRRFRHVCPRLMNNAETEEVEGIVLQPSKKMELLNLRAKVFTKMTRLKNLNICNVQLPNDLEYLSNELTKLNLDGCCLKCFPRTFRPEHLEELYLSNSCLEQLWDGKLLLPKLRIVVFCNLTHLTKCPDFTEAPELEKLLIKDCKSLVDVHQLFGVLTKLKYLQVVGCRNLGSVAASMDCKSLGCLKLRENECLVGCEDMESLSNPDHSGCPKLMNIPEFSENMKDFQWLELGMTGVVELPLSVGLLENLDYLNLSHCQNLRSLPDFICQLKALKTLLLKGCSKLEKLPSSSGAHPMELKHLCIDGCKKITPDSLNSFLSFSISRTSLDRLTMGECNLKSVPAALCSLCSLGYLKLDGNDFERLPAGMNQLTGLWRLKLEGCKRLEELPEMSPTLTSIHAPDCQSLRAVSRSLFQTLRSTLRHFLDFSNCIRLLGNEQILEALLSSAAQGLIAEWLTIQASILRAPRVRMPCYPCKADIRFPGNEIPKWFSCDKVELLSANRRILGFAACAVVEIDELPAIFLHGRLRAAQLNIEDLVFGDLDLMSGEELRPRDTETLWITFGRFYRREDELRGHSFSQVEIDEVDRLIRLRGSELATFTITPIWQGFKIKSCGLRIVFEGDDFCDQCIHGAQAVEKEEEEEDTNDVVAASMPKKRHLGCSETGNLNDNVDDVDGDEEEEREEDTHPNNK